MNETTSTGSSTPSKAAPTPSKAARTNGTPTKAAPAKATPPKRAPAKGAPAKATPRAGAKSAPAIKPKPQSGAGVTPTVKPSSQTSDKPTPRIKPTPEKAAIPATLRSQAPPEHAADRPRPSTTSTGAPTEESPDAVASSTDSNASGANNGPNTGAMTSTQAATKTAAKTAAKTATKLAAGEAGADGAVARPDAPRPDAPRPQSPPDEEPPVGKHRRGPGIWLPLIIFVTLLVAGAIAGTLVVPGAGPNPGAEPPANAIKPDLTQPVPVQTSPDGPSLPTPPVREANKLSDWANRIGAAVTVPAVAVQAYGYAQLTVNADDPVCHLSWTTLAAIGQTESAHGQANGAVLQSNGRSAPLIVGPVLDGKGGRALVNDTDAGAFDGDTTYDRAMGPMGLTPTEWKGYGIDADGDGILDPYDIDDSSLALARLLCSGTEDLTQRAGWNAAIARHNPNSAYAKSVFTSADSYGQRTKNMG